MGNEATSRLMMEHEHTASVYTYETITSIAAIEPAVRHITTTDSVNQVALVTITLSFDNDTKTSNGRLIYSDPTASIAYLMSSLRPLVRRTDLAFLLNSTLLFLLRGANLQGGQIVQSRLWDALLWRIHNLAESEFSRPSDIASGYNAYPAPSSNIDDFIKAALNASLHSNFGTEKAARKPVARQDRTLQACLSEDELSALARKLGIPYLSLLPRRRLERVQQLVNASLAQELHCYPVGRERNTLTVAMLNPQDQHALERLHQETGLDIFPVLTHPQELQTALEQLM